MTNSTDLQTASPGLSSPSNSSAQIPVIHTPTTYHQKHPLKDRHQHRPQHETSNGPRTQAPLPTPDNPQPKNQTQSIDHPIIDFPPQHTLRQSTGIIPTVSRATGMVTLPRTSRGLTASLERCYAAVGIDSTFPPVRYEM